jgi:hypothetical protein
MYKTDTELSFNEIRIKKKIMRQITVIVAQGLQKLGYQVKSYGSSVWRGDVLYLSYDRSNSGQRRVVIFHIDNYQNLVFNEYGWLDDHYKHLLITFSIWTKPMLNELISNQLGIKKLKFEGSTWIKESHVDILKKYIPIYFQPDKGRKLLKGKPKSCPEVDDFTPDEEKVVQTPDHPSPKKNYIVKIPKKKAIAQPATSSLPKKQFVLYKGKKYIFK